MLRVLVRRLAIGAMGGLLASLYLAPTASAVVPPGGSGSFYKCGTIAAGYTPFNGEWVWDPRLSFEWCVVRTSTGSKYAIARLSSPGPASLSGDWDLAWVSLDVKLVTCQLATVKTVAWDTPSLVQGVLSGSRTSTSSRYYWPWKQTPSTTSATPRTECELKEVGTCIAMTGAGGISRLAQGRIRPALGAITPIQAAV